MSSNKQMFIKLLVLLLFSKILCNSDEELETSNEEVNKSCEQLYEEGVNSYLDNDFKGCVEKLETSLETYKTFKQLLQNCRLQCNKEASYSIPLYSIDVFDLHFFEKAIRNTLCIIKCKKKHPELSDENSIASEIDKKFKKEIPYEYLHLCYYQTGKYQLAASAAFTYLVYNPNSTSVQKSLEHYLTFPEVDKNDIVNYEAKDYVNLYAHGSNAYEKKLWKEAIDFMEESLSSYFQSEEECRAQCEGPYDHHGFYPDFIPAIANHFTIVLKCKRLCRYNLNNINGQKYEDFLPSHYDYLQFSYFKEKNYEAACEAVASYLLFHPEDKIMLTNKEYYLNLPKVEDYFFTPREEAVTYIQRQAYEEKILKFIADEFTYN